MKNTDDTTTATAAAVNPDLAALTGDYTIDPAHSTIGFVARHAMVTNVKGKFGEFTGSLHLDGADPSRSTATIDVVMQSVDTGSADRDNHLRSADFFDVEAHQTMTFRSTGVRVDDDGDYILDGDLTLRDGTAVSHPSVS